MSLILGQPEMGSQWRMTARFFLLPVPYSLLPDF